MKRHWKRVARIVTAAFLLCGCSPLLAQVGTVDNLSQLNRKGTIKAITSMRTSSKLYVAVWYEFPSKKAPAFTTPSLRIYESEANRYREVFKLDSDIVFAWKHLTSFNSERLPGFMLMASNGISNYGPITVIALVEDKFKVVYEGDQSEFPDMNGDGIPEILESVWPNDDGYPETTSVHLWDGQKYSKSFEVKWDERFSLKVRNTINDVARRGRERE